MSPEDIEPLVEELAELGSPLMLPLKSTEIGSAVGWAQLTRRAADSGLGCRAWLLLPVADGYWPGATNAELVASAMIGLADWCARPDGPKLEAISIDLEPDLAYSESLRAAQKTDPSRWLQLLAEHARSDRLGPARARSLRARSKVRRRLA